MSLANGIDKPIFILGCHKSGTTLLRSLFDGHPDLFVIPFEAHFFQNLSKWVDYRLRATLPMPLTSEKIRQRLIDWVKRCNEAYDPQSDNFSQGRWDVQRFSDYLNKVNPSSQREWFDTYIFALYYSLYATEMPRQKRFVEKSVENAEFVAELQAMYPKAFFIHIIRNPYATLVSIRKYKSRNGYPFLGPILRAMYNSYYYLYKNQGLYKNYYVLKYEDLITSSDMEMTAIASFVEIAKDQIFLMPTVLGENWGGNSTSGKKFNGISTAALHSWRNQIYPYEVLLINRLFPFVLDDYGYPHLEVPCNRWMPMPGERPKTFVRNRALFI